MSICCNSLRLISRTRVPAASKSIAPFLYQTSTIQQWTPTRQSIAHRYASSRIPKNPPTQDDDIPFENADIEALPPAIDEIELLRQTTITGSERAAFEKLYHKFNAQNPPKGDTLLKPEVDQIADEWYEEDEDQDGEEGDDDASLDSVFDKVLAGVPAPGKKVSGMRRKKPAEDLASLAASILKEEEGKAGRHAKVKGAEATRMKAVREAERARVTGLMKQAQTDRELWEILEREVLGVIRKLDLDDVKKTLRSQVDQADKPKNRKASAKSATAEPTSTLPVFPTTLTDTPFYPPKSSKPDSTNIFSNYPAHLYNAALLLRNNFPSSALPLAILPTIKSVGRSSFALGASTSLYNLLIRTAWQQHASYDYIDELLGDMDNAGVEFDVDTLNILDSVIEEFQNVRRGELGQTVQTVWAMEQFGEGAKRLQKWRDVVVQRLGITMSQRARDGKVVRRQESSSVVLTREFGDGAVRLRKVVTEGGEMRTGALTASEYRLKPSRMGGEDREKKGGGSSALDELMDASLLSEYERKRR